jgi:hypothetical protein
MRRMSNKYPTRLEHSRARIARSSRKMDFVDLLIGRTPCVKGGA